MDTKQKMESALKDGMRSNDDTVKRTLRVALATLKLAEVEKGSSLDENSLLAIIQKEIKGRHESIQDAQKANRPDLVQSYQMEIAILEKFLPKQLSPQEINDLARSAIEEAGAVSIADMGKVMKLLLPRVQGRAPGDQISQAVRQLLTSSS